MTTLLLSGRSFGVTSVTSAGGNPLAIARAATAFAATVDPRATVVSTGLNSLRMSRPSASYFCGALVPCVCACTPHDAHAAASNNTAALIDGMRRIVACGSAARGQANVLDDGHARARIEFRWTRAVAFGVQGERRVLEFDAAGRVAE